MPTSRSTTDARGALASFLELIRPAGQRRTTGGDRDRLELGLVAVALRQKAFAGGGIAHRDRLARDREARRSRRDDDRIAVLDHRLLLQDRKSTRLNSSH